MVHSAMEKGSNESSALQTAYHDLLGIISLMRSQENKKYSAVPMYSLGRDVCLILYQINKDVFSSSYVLNPEIKKSGIK